MLVRCVIDNKVKYDLHLPLVALFNQALAVLDSPIRAMYGLVTRDV